jgi:hypothetical protein
MNTVIHFPDDFLPYIDVWRVKGFANLEVTLDGARYRLSFVDLGNVKQALETGPGHFAEPGMVAVREISEDMIRNAVDQLAKSGYFYTLAPISSRT